MRSSCVVTYLLYLAGVLSVTVFTMINASFEMSLGIGTMNAAIKEITCFARRGGYRVLKPWGESEPFDLAINFADRIVRFR